MERFFIFYNDKNMYNTYYNWNLILTSKTITPPEVKTNNVEIDGMNGSLDLTEALSGEPVYKNRTVSATFWTDVGKRTERESLVQEIILTLHGQHFNIIEPDAPDKHFIGRISVKSYENNLAYLTFTIDCTCEPYRYGNQQRSVRLMWKNGIHNFGRKTIIPTFRAMEDISINIVFNENTYTIIKDKGSVFDIPEIKLKHGVNNMICTPHNAMTIGNINLNFREGYL